MDFGAIRTANLAAATTSTGRSSNFGCKGYTTLLLDLDISSTAVVAYEATGEGGTFKGIVGTNVNGATASSTAATSTLARFNITGMDAFRINVVSLSVGNVTANVTAMAGGTTVTT